MTVTVASSYSSNLTPGLGTSICRGYGPKKQEKKKKKKRVTWLNIPEAKRIKPKRRSVLTEQNDDAEQDGNDGTCAQPRPYNSIHICAVPVGVTLANLHSKDGNI